MHIPVLLKEVIKSFDPKENENYVDCTLGEGGHSLEILKRIIPHGKLLGIDLDKRNLSFVKEKFISQNITEKNFILANGNFKDIEKIVAENNFDDISGILFDLGLNSYFLEESKRGFSFKYDEVLDMRFNEETELTAKDVVNKYSKTKIQDILEELGEESFARNIAENIIQSRKKQEIRTTFDLNEIVFKSTPHWYQKRKIHASTKTFMALRIYVNQEFENLKKALSGASKLISKEGKIAIITFHSLEDKIVKNYFKEMVSQGDFRMYNKKVIKPNWTEIKHNRRSRSAKLRVIIKN